VFIKEVKAEKPKLRIIWLHGWGQNHKAFLEMSSFFENDANSYFFDLPGFGASKLPPVGWGTQDYADLIIKWIDKTPTDLPTIFIGHSFGCRVSIRLAEKRKDIPKALILIGAAGLKKKRSPLFIIKAFFLKILGKTAQITDMLFNTQLKQAYREKFGSRDYKNAGKLRPTFIKTISEDLTKNAKNINCPTLLLFGQNDTETPPEFGRKYEKLIKDSKYIEYQGLDHYSVLKGGKTRLIKDIKKFINDIQK
jgi:pimeloyl-ACP methyl ester carboxylesterase